MRIIKDQAVGTLKRETDFLTKHQVYRLRQRNTLKGMSLEGMQGSAAQAATQLIQAQCAAVAGIDRFCNDLLLADLKNITMIQRLDVTSSGVLDTAVAQDNIDFAKNRIRWLEAACEEELRWLREQQESGAWTGGESARSIREKYKASINSQKTTIAVNERTLNKAKQYERDVKALYGSIDTSVLSGLCNSVASVARGEGLGSTTWIDDMGFLPKDEKGDAKKTNPFVNTVVAGIAAMGEAARAALEEMRSLESDGASVAGATGAHPEGTVLAEGVSTGGISAGQQVVSSSFDAAMREIPAEEPVMDEVDSGEPTVIAEIADFLAEGGAVSVASTQTEVGNDAFELSVDSTVGELSAKDSFEMSFGKETNKDGTEKSAGITVGKKVELKVYEGDAGASGSLLGVPYEFDTNIVVGDAVVKGEFSASIINEKGEFDPNAHLAVGGSVTAVEVGAKAKVGTDAVGGEVEAKGKFLTASAKADASFSMEEGFDFETKVGAYLATGELSGTFEIFGVKFISTTELQAGGAGVAAGAEVQNGSMSFELGAGIGVGVTEKLTVDFSDLTAAVMDENSWLGEYVTYTRDTGSDYFMDMRNL